MHHKSNMDECWRRNERSARVRTNKRNSLQANRCAREANKTTLALSRIGRLNEIAFEETNQFVDGFNVLGRIALAHTLLDFETGLLALLIVAGAQFLRVNFE